MGRGRLLNAKSGSSPQHTDTVDSNAPDQSGNPSENSDSLPKMDESEQYTTPPVKRRGRPAKTPQTNTDELSHSVKNTTKMATPTHMGIIDTTQIDERKRLPPPAPVVPEITDCRRSSRKKVLKFDVRDLLNKKSKSKIKIEARIDSNAPPLGASPKNPIELENKKKNFIEKAAIFRRFSMSENKIPVKPIQSLLPSAIETIVIDPMPIASLSRPYACVQPQNVCSMIQESIDTRKSSISPAGQKRRGRPPKNKSLIGCEPTQTDSEIVIDLDEIEDSCDSVRTNCQINKNYIAKAIAVDLDLDSSNSADCVKLDSRIKPTTIVDRLKAASNESSCSSDDVVVVSIETAPADEFLSRKRESKRNTKTASPEPVDFGDSIDVVSIQSSDMTDSLIEVELIEAPKPTALKTYSRNRPRNQLKQIEVQESSQALVPDSPSECADSIIEIEVETTEFEQDGMLNDQIENKTTRNSNRIQTNVEQATAIPDERPVTRHTKKQDQQKEIEPEDASEVYPSNCAVELEISNLMKRITDPPAEEEGDDNIQRNKKPQRSSLRASMRNRKSESNEKEESVSDLNNTNLETDILIELNNESELRRTFVEQPDEPEEKGCEVIVISSNLDNNKTNDDNNDKTKSFLKNIIGVQSSVLKPEDDDCKTKPKRKSTRTDLKQAKIESNKSKNDIQCSIESEDVNSEKLGNKNGIIINLENKKEHQEEIVSLIPETIVEINTDVIVQSSSLQQNSSAKDKLSNSLEVETSDETTAFKLTFAETTDDELMISLSKNVETDKKYAETPLNNEKNTKTKIQKCVDSNVIDESNIAESVLIPVESAILDISSELNLESSTSKAAEIKVIKTRVRKAISKNTENDDKISDTTKRRKNDRKSNSLAVEENLLKSESGITESSHRLDTPAPKSKKIENNEKKPENEDLKPKRQKSTTEKSEEKSPKSTSECSTSVINGPSSEVFNETPETKPKSKKSVYNKIENNDKLSETEDVKSRKLKARTETSVEKSSKVISEAAVKEDLLRVESDIKESVSALKPEGDVGAETSAYKAKGKKSSSKKIESDSGETKSETADVKPKRQKSRPEASKESNSQSIAEVVTTVVKEESTHEMNSEQHKVSETTGIKSKGKTFISKKLVYETANIKDKSHLDKNADKEPRKRKPADTLSNSDNYQQDAVQNVSPSINELKSPKVNRKRLSFKNTLSNTTKLDKTDKPLNEPFPSELKAKPTTEISTNTPDRNKNSRRALGKKSESKKIPEPESNLEVEKESIPPKTANLVNIFKDIDQEFEIFQTKAKKNSTKKSKTAKILIGSSNGDSSTESNSMTNSVDDAHMETESKSSTVVGEAESKSIIAEEDLKVTEDKKELDEQLKEVLTNLKTNEEMPPLVSKVESSDGHNNKEYDTNSTKCENIIDEELMMINHVESKIGEFIKIESQNEIIIPSETNSSERNECKKEELIKLENVLKDDPGHINGLKLAPTKPRKSRWSAIEPTIPVIDQIDRPTSKVETEIKPELNDPLRDIEKFIEAGVNLLNQSLSSEGEEDVKARRPKALSDCLDDVKEENTEVIGKDAEAEEKTIKSPCTTDTMDKIKNQLDSKCAKSENKILIKQLLEEIKSTFENHSEEVQPIVTSSSNNIRRSNRIEKISQTKSVMKVGRGLVRDRDRFKDENGLGDYITDLRELDVLNQKFLKDMEERLTHFKVIRDNDYKCERVISKEAKNMECDCFLTREEEDRGEFGCGEDCLNRMLLIECGLECVVGERCTNRRFQKYLHSPCKVFRTEKKGFGISADAVIYPGDFIMEYVGEVINNVQFEDRRYEYSLDKNIHHYFMELRSDAIIDATTKGNISRFINHSCDPNAVTQKWTVNGELRIGFFCMKQIMPGEEIVFDYQFQRYGKVAQKCYCESANCRGWIGGEPDSEGEEEEEEEYEEEIDEDEESEEEGKRDEDVLDVLVEKKPIGEDLIEGNEVETAISTEEPKIEENLAPTIPKKKLTEKKKRKTKRPTIAKEDPDIEEEVHSLLRTGLKNQYNTLCLSRLMVRSKLIETRLKLLEILRVGEIVCKRLFLDYHGLRLLHGWMSEMVDTQKNSTKDSEVRLALLETLEVLPIQNKTSLKDSKIYDIVQNWANNKESLLPSQLSQAAPTDENSEISKLSPTESNVNIEIHKLSVRLVAVWEQLPEVFKIPKRERIEQMKEHEREADRQYKALNLGDDERKTNRDKDRFGKRRRSCDRERDNDKSKMSKYKWTKDKSDRESWRKATTPKDSPSLDTNLSKFQRRQLFAAKVARDEAEKRLLEERHEFSVKCRFFGIDPKLISIYDIPFSVDDSGHWRTVDKRIIGTPPLYQHYPAPAPKKRLSTNPNDYNMPAIRLPPKWRYAIDTSGRLYYYNIKLRIPQWDIPVSIVPNPTDDNVETTDESDISVSDSELKDIEIGSEKYNAIVERNLEKRRKFRVNRISRERPISPRKEEDRLFNQIEMRKYKENKEKIRKRKEEIRRRKSLLAEGKISTETKTAGDGDDDDDNDPTALPIHDYLISSDEDETIKVECNSPLMDRIVQGDKLLDELDALKIRKSLKRPTSSRERHEHKKRKLEKKNKILEEGSSKAKKKDSDDKSYRKVKEQFRNGIAGIIVHHLTPYRKETCPSGRITSSDDFKHLARKLTHFVMIKELKYCESIGQPLVVSESVKNKSREFIRKYMSKYGEVYIRPQNDPEFREIQC